MPPAPRTLIAALPALLLIILHLLAGTATAAAAAAPSATDPLLPASFATLFRRQSTGACYALINSACPGPDCISATCSTTCTSTIPGLQSCCDAASFNQFVTCVQQLDDPDSGPSSSSSRSRTSSAPGGQTTPFTPGVIAPVTGYSTDLPSRFTSLVSSARPPFMSPSPSVSVIGSASGGSAGPSAAATATVTATATATANAAGGSVDGRASWKGMAVHVVAIVLGALV